MFMFKNQNDGVTLIPILPSKWSRKVLFGHIHTTGGSADAHCAIVIRVNDAFIAIPELKHNHLNRKRRGPRTGKDCDPDQAYMANLRKTADCQHKEYIIAPPSRKV